MSRIPKIVLLACLGSLLDPAYAVVFFRGKVVMDDGSSPGTKVIVERHCLGMQDRVEAVTDKLGQFIWRSQVDPLYEIPVARCLLTAVLKGYHSSTIDLTDSRFGSTPVLPNLILTKAAEGPGLDLSEDNLPRHGGKQWDLGIKALEERRWFDAERQMTAVVQAAPRFTAGWSALGIALETRRNSNRRERHFRRPFRSTPRTSCPITSSPTSRWTLANGSWPPRPPAPSSASIAGAAIPPSSSTMPSSAIIWATSMAPKPPSPGLSGWIGSASSPAPSTSWG